MVTLQPDYRTPRWVKLFGAVVIILIILFALLHVLGGGMADMHHLFDGSTTP